MSFIVRILQCVACVAMILVVYGFWYTQVLGSNQQFSELLTKSHGYDATTILISSELQKTIVVSGVSQDQLKTLVSSALTPGLTKQLLQPTQITFLDWLSSRQSVHNLQISIDISPLKQALISQAPDAKTGFEFKKSLPDSFSLISPETHPDQLGAVAENIRASYLFAKLMLFWAAVIALGALILLVISNIHKGSKKLRAPAWPIGLSGAVIVLVAGIFFFIQNFHLVSSTMTLESIQYVLPFAILQTMSYDTLPIGVGMVVLSFAIIMISKTVFRARDKKLKAKHA